MKQNDRGVEVPRWHYRDVREGMREMLANAPKIGSLEKAMEEFVSRRAGELPQGMTATDAVARIRTSVDGFLAAHEEGRSTEDIRNRLRAIVGEMESREAMVYLAFLETTFRVCDARALGGEKLPSATELSDGILGAVQTATPEEIGSRVDALATALAGDSLKAYVFTTGNEEMKTLVSACGGEGAVPRTELDERLYEALCSNVNRGEMFAAAACACYGMVLDGKIPGMRAENLDVGVMTELVVAGLEKASILTRLSRGEIDLELAKDMLAELARVVKWVLVKSLQLIVVGGAFLAAGVLSAYLELLAPVAALVMATGLILGVTAAMSMGEKFEEAADLTVELFETAATLVMGVFSWTWEKATGAVRQAAAMATARRLAFQ